MKGPLRGRNLSLLLGQKIPPTLASSIARTGFPPPNCSIQICQRSVAASFISTIRNAPSPIRLANLSMLEGGRRLFPKIRKNLAGMKVWLDADTFMKHKVSIPEKHAHLLGDESGCKST
jgi:hypothetical protein